MRLGDPGPPWRTGPVRNSQVEVILQEEPARLQEQQFAEMHADMQKCNLWLHVCEFTPQKTDFFFFFFFNTVFLAMLQVEASVSTGTSCCHLRLSPPRDLGGGGGVGVKAQGHVHASGHQTGKTGNRRNI